MARLVVSGGEVRDHTTTDIGSPDGVTGGAAATTTETTTFRSGNSAIKCAGTAANTSFRWFPLGTVASGTGVYGRAYIYVSALPNATKKVAAFVTSADGALVSARLTAAGKLQLWNDAGAAQIGGDSALTLATGAWYRVEVYLKIAAGAADEAELRVTDDAGGSTEQVATATGLTVSDTVPARFRAGWIDAPGVTASMFLDDVAVNDSTTAKQNTWPGPGRVLLLTGFYNTFGTGPWTSCKTTTAAADGIAATSNRPPLGHADLTTDTTAHQMRNVSAAAPPKDYKVYVNSPASQGVPGDVLADDNILTGVNAIRWGAEATGGRAMIATSFFLAGAVYRVDFHLHTVGAPTDNMIIELRTDDGTSKPSTTVLDTWTKPGTDLTTTFTWYTWRLTVPIALTPGSRYWLSYRRSGALDLSNYYEIARNGVGRGDQGDRTVILNQGTDPATGWVSPNFMSGAMRIYSTSGIAGVRHVAVCVCHAEGDAAGTKTMELQSLKSPAIATQTQNFGPTAGGAAGTYPTNWAWAQIKADEPTFRQIDVGPGIRVGKTDTTTGIGLICFAGAYIDYSDPPAPG